MTRLLRQLSNIAWWVSLLMFIGCSDSVKETSKDEQKYSRTQKYLFKLLDDYKVDYFAATQKGDKENIREKYLLKMQQFLEDSLGRYIDSMAVTVDTVIQNDRFMTTQFHSKDIEFKYGMTFTDTMQPSWDSLYKFMLSLSPGKEVLVNFIHLGGGELNYPDDKSKRTIRIFAYPQPLKSLK